VPSPVPTPSSAAPVITLPGDGVLFATLPFNTPPVIVPPQTSDDSLTSVSDTDTGSSLFGGISSNPQAGSNSGGSTSGSRPTGTGSSPSSNVQTASAGSNPGQEPASGSDSGDRAMNVMAQPPGIQPVSHGQPLPQKVTTPLVPGLVDQVQPGTSPPKGVPGVTTNFSSSGNSNAW